jgi:hypothetical protein
MVAGGGGYFDVILLLEECFFGRIQSFIYNFQILLSSQNVRYSVLEVVSHFRCILHR